MLGQSGRVRFYNKLPFQIFLSYAIIILSVAAVSVAVIVSINQLKERQNQFSDRITTYLQNLQTFSNSATSYLVLVERLASNRDLTFELEQQLTSVELRTVETLETIKTVTSSSEKDEIRSLLSELFVGVDQLITLRTKEIELLDQELEIKFTSLQRSMQQVENIIKRAEVIAELNNQLTSEQSLLYSDIIENISRARIAISFVYPTNTTADIAIAQSDYIGSIRAIVDDNIQIRDREIKKEISIQTDVLLSAIAPNDGFFAKLGEYNSARLRFNDLVDENLEIESALNDKIARLISIANAQTQDDIIDITQLSQRNLILSTYALAGTMVVGLLIVIFYVNPRLIGRINALANATKTIADGNLAQPIKTIGHDEISNMNEALEGFRLKLIDKEKIEGERETLIESLNASNLQLAQFAYICSHDLQQPLRMISAFSGKLEERLNEINPDLSKDEKLNLYLDQLIKGATNGQELIRGVLEYSKLDQSNQNFQPVDCGEVVAEILATFEAETDTPQITIAGQLPSVLGIKTQIYQLFHNLISNGLKYAKVGETPKVHISAQQAGEFIIFEIKDNGIGIDAKYHASIFEIFRRLHRKDEFPGIGIGLSICKKIVDNHRGTIEVESELGKGSIFRISLLKV